VSVENVEVVVSDETEASLQVAMRRVRGLLRLLADEQVGVLEAPDDEVDALLAVELLSVLIRQEVPALSFRWRDDGNLAFGSELLDVVVESAPERLNPCLRDRLVGSDPFGPSAETAAPSTPAG
jgi:hypothetical protein